MAEQTSQPSPQEKSVDQKGSSQPTVANTVPDKQKNTANQTKTKQSKAGGTTTSSSGTGKLWFFIFFLLILVIGAGAGGSYLWFTLQKIQAQNQLVIADLKKSLRTLDEHSAIIELKQRILEQDNKIANALAEQQARNDALREAFTVTQQIVNRDQRGWILAEVEYLLRLANTRLRLLLDVKGATEALITADQRLRDLADPAVLKIREILANEITALKSIQAPDIHGAALRLISISDRLHLLPAAKRPPVADIQAANRPLPVAVDDEPFYERFWEKLLSLLQVRRIDAPGSTHVLHSGLYYVDQQIRLEVDAARQAVLRLDRADFERRVLTARSLLDENYDRNNEQVILLKADLTALLEANLFPELPNITGSLNALLKLQEQYKPALEPVAQ